MAKNSYEKYEGLLNPQPIEIELRGRLPSYDIGQKLFKKYPFFNGYTFY